MLMQSAPARGVADGRPNGPDFATLTAAYRGSGGMERGDDLARLLEERLRGDFLTLARLIASRQIFSFPWQHSLWVPMFQFDPVDLSIGGAAHQVVRELTPGRDGWALARWFALPHRRLDAQRPVDLLRSDLAAVLRTARADGGGPAG